MGIRTRRAHMHSKTHVVGFGIAGVFGFIALLVIALSLSLGAVVSSWLEDLPDYTSADSYLVAEPTRLFDADGNEIASYYLQQRRSVDLSEISDYVVKGTVDTEDKRFYQHNGVDPQGIVRAVFSQLAGRSEGASTITQQLVRNTILQDEQFEYSLKRKVREAYIAIQMEKMYTKEQILNMYLNTIYYGNGAYGIEAASIIYFNKHASDLSLSEAATLIGLPNSPSYYDPTVNPDACKTRRNTVLDRMLSAGTITQEEHDAAEAEDIVLNEGELSDPVGTYPYFTDYVRTLLLQNFDSETIFQGGLKIYTTLDPTYQEAAQEAVTSRIESAGNDSVDAALVCIDNSNGYIKAIVGGSDYEKRQYNGATQAQRQAGSSFKTFVLCAAVSQGMNPDIMINCTSPMTITPTWTVRNYGNHDYGTRSLASATAISSNTAYAQVAEAVGVQSIIDTATSMGLGATLESNLSIALGAVSVSPLQMCEAYSTIAADGVHHEAVAITKIEDRNGNTIYEHQDSSEQALEKGVAEAVIEVLEGVCTSGNTGYYVASNFTADQPVAGKTGTSDNSENLWFCGFTPQLTTVVWCGNPDANVEVYYQGATGTTQNLPQPIWCNFMNTVLSGVSREEFPSGNKVTYKSNSEWTFVGTSASTNDYSSSYSDDDDSDESSSSSSSSTRTDTSGSSTSGSGTSGSGTSGSGTSGSGTSGGSSTDGGTSGGGTSGGGTSGGGESSGGESGGGTSGGGETPTPTPTPTQ
jgi:penicillin-binding protein 2D